MANAFKVWKQMAIVETSGDSMGMISDKEDTTIEELDTAAALEISADVPKFWEEMAMEETSADSMEMISDEEDTSNGELDTASAVEISADVPKVL